MITARDEHINEFESRVRLDDVTQQHNCLAAIHDNFKGHLAALQVACDKDKFPCVVLEDNVILR